MQHIPRLPRCSWRAVHAAKHMPDRSTGDLYCSSPSGHDHTENVNLDDNLDPDDNQATYYDEAADGDY